MNTKPSDWAMRVWLEALRAVDPIVALQWHKNEAAALVIEQTFEKREAEMVEWLRTEAAKDTPFDLDPMAALGLVLDMAAASIERGEYRKDRG
jgi:hypothetical protein